MKRVVIFFLILISLEGFGQRNSQKQKQYTSIKATEFYIKMNSAMDALVLDVRLFSEYREERIEGAILAEKKGKLLSLTDTIDKERPVLVYCSDGERSKTVCNILIREQNIYHVYNLKNGLQAWKRHGLPLDQEKLQPKILRKIFKNSD